MEISWNTETKDRSFEIGEKIKNVIAQAADGRVESLNEITDFSFGDDKEIAINENKLSVTINKIEKISENTDALFKDLEECISDISYFNCSATQDLSKELNIIGNNIPIFRANILSYITDLRLVDKNFDEVNVLNINMIRKEKARIPTIEAYKEKE